MLIATASVFVIQTVAQDSFSSGLAFTGLSRDLLKGSNAVIRQDERYLEVINPEDAKLNVRKAITILNEKGDEEKGYIQIDYDNFYTKVADLKAGIYDRSGRLLEKIRKKDFQDLSEGSFEVTDTRYLIYKPNYREYPYTIYMEYTLRLSGLIFMPGWQPLNRSEQSLESGKFVVSTPKDMDIRYKTVGGMQDGSRKEENGAVFYTWEMKDLPALEYEPYSAVIQSPGVLLGPNEFEVDGYEGNGSNWKDFGLFHYKLNEGREKITPELAEKVREMTANAGTPYEKVNILYKYLQENTRYMSIQLGLGGFQTMTAEKVVETGYGDCKALTYFMKGMLNEIGIPSYASLIHRGKRQRYFHTDFASSQFNHVLLCVPLESDTIWVECTNDDIPAGYLSTDDYDRYTLLLTKEGGMLRRTPTPVPEDNRQVRKAKVILQEKGGARAEVLTLFTGFQQDWPREMTTQTDQKYQEKWLMERLNLPNVEIQSLSIDKSENSPVCTLSYKISSRKWAKSSGSRLFLRLHQLEDPYFIPPLDEDRENPIVWRSTFLDQDSVFIDLPEGYVVEALGEPETKVERPYGHYKHEIKVTTDGDLIYFRELRLDKCFLEPEEYENFRQFFIEIRKAEQKQVVLNKRS